MDNQKIIDAVCKFHEISKEELFSKEGNQAVIWAKRCYSFILYYHSRNSITEIAKTIQRSITSTYRYISWYEDIYVANSEVRNFITKILYYNS